MAADVQRYFKRNAYAARWYADVESISVNAGVVTVGTALDLNRASGRQAAADICNLIQGSDVADFTPGHTVRGQGTRAVVCPPRTDRR